MSSRANPKHRNGKSQLVPSDLKHKVSATEVLPGELVVPGEEAPDLDALAELYLRTEVDRRGRSSTFKAKRADLQRFLDYFVSTFGHYRSAEWYVSTTRDWLRELGADRTAADTTIARRFRTLRHFARWTDQKFSPFPLGCPTDGVKEPEVEDPDWGGLERKNVQRLVAAAHHLVTQSKRGGTKTGARDMALLQGLLHSGLRISELLALDISQFDNSGRFPGFTNVPKKGGGRRKFVRLWDQDAGEALKSWLDERGREPGPIFTTRTGRALRREQAWKIVKRMEAQANAHLPSDERFSVTPHALRHTCLRALAEQKGIQVAMKQSGHKSDRYIWLYTQPSDRELRELATDLL